MSWIIQRMLVHEFGALCNCCASDTFSTFSPLLPWQLDVNDECCACARSALWGCKCSTPVGNPLRMHRALPLGAHNLADAMQGQEGLWPSATCQVNDGRRHVLL